MPLPGDGKKSRGMSSEDEFAVVWETTVLNVVELARIAAARSCL